MVFVTDIKCVSFEIGTKILYINYMNLPPQTLLSFAVDFIHPRLSCYTNFNVVVYASHIAFQRTRKHEEFTLIQPHTRAKLISKFQSKAAKNILTYFPLLMTKSTSHRFTLFTCRL
jgi:hypothetical protein